MNLWLAPHNDDETLFGSFTILRHHPHVVVCLRSDIQAQRGGPHFSQREHETDAAIWWLQAPSWQQLLTLDTDPNYMEKVVGDLEKLGDVHSPDIVWAPAIEDGGHEQHNGVGLAALCVFGEERVRQYLTYRRGHLSSRGREVPFEPSWVHSKMRAMCCYTSQIELEATRPWFMDDTLREFVHTGEIERISEDDGA